MNKKTNFFTIAFENKLPPNFNEFGMPIGNGKCKAVILRTNLMARNKSDIKVPSNSTGATVAFYVGDQNSQEYEVMIGQDSPLFLCNDLSEIFIRMPLGWRDIDPDNMNYAIQVIVYDF